MIDTTKMMINKARQLTTRIHKLEQKMMNLQLMTMEIWTFIKVPDKGFPDYIGHRNHIIYTQNRDSNTEHPTAHHSSSLTTALNRSQRLQHWRRHCLPSLDEDQMTESLL